MLEEKFPVEDCPEPDSKGVGRSPQSRSPDVPKWAPNAPTASEKSITFRNASLSDLKPFARNARRHSRAQVKQIAESIVAFGFTNPILVDEDGTIIAGHGRLLAAKKLNLDCVPVFRLEGLSHAQKSALRIADNKIAESSSWNLDLLREELTFLVREDCVELSGVSSIELDRLLTPVDPGDIEEDKPPPTPVLPVSRVGDCWQLGEHKVICGDALRLETFRALLGPEVADLVLTDPPYNVPIPGNVSGQGRVKHQNFEMACGEMSPEQFESFLKAALENSGAVARDGALLYAFMDWRGIDRLLAAAASLGYERLNICVWTKSNAGMGSLYRSQHELVGVFKKGAAPHVNNVQLGRLGRHRSNVWHYPGATSFSRSRAKDLADHPTVKPIAMMADVIRDASQPGGLVLDPFGGSGSTLIAAECVGRRARLIELDPKYVDVILARFKKRFGVDPTLAPFGTPVTQVEAQRRGGANE